MFDNLCSKLQNILSRLKSRGKLTPEMVEEAMKELRIALLEADVNFRVVKDFINKIWERAVGVEVMESLTPGQQVVKIVNEELTQMMGSTSTRIPLASKLPTILMLTGLQGSGKTTAVAKLANYYKKEGRKSILIAADVYRPAAVDQLVTLAREVGSDYYFDEKEEPVDIAAKGVEMARKTGCDIAIVDTAGRLHIDEKMMIELEEIKKRIRPHQILLVVDSMTGQDAVNLAKIFSERIDIDGVLLTKLDGDARGGAALSVKAVTGKPILFVSQGEKIDSLEPFHPERMASRILGMGDVLSLIEKAQATVDEKRAKEMEEKLRKAEFTLDDFLEQMQQIKKMGPISSILGMLPSMPGMDKIRSLNFSGKEVEHVEAIIRSMTRQEREKPVIIDGSRRKRIARGSGRPIQEVNKLLKQFEDMKRMIKQFSGKAGKGPGKPVLPFGL